MNNLRVIFTAVAGNGGKGAITYRQIKNNAKAGPSGGCGGNGGHIILKSEARLNNFAILKNELVKSASTFKYSDSLRHSLIATDGKDGSSNRGQGQHGVDRIVAIPVGCKIIDLANHKTLVESSEENQLLVVARAGAGGQGNSLMRNSIDRCPRFAQMGAQGQRRDLEILYPLPIESSEINRHNCD
ncbi:MAG: hypothetical protein MHMPM18_003641 [Marteilia pararefringens]